MKRVLNNKKKGRTIRIIVNSTIVHLMLLFIILSFPTGVFAGNYIVKSASELSSVTPVLLPGDTIKLTAGTWTNEELVFKGTGTKNQNIVLTVETKNATVLTGTSQLVICGEYLTVDGLRFEDGHRGNDAVVEFRKNSSELSHNCRLTNTSIINYNPSNKDNDYKWVSVYGTNNRIDHCHFEGKTHSGTTLVVWITDEPNYTQIDHNYFGARPDLGYNGGETIRIGTSSNSMKESRAIVEYNLFEECDGEIEIISNKSCFNTYRYNTFRNNEGCLTLRHGNDCEVYGNYFIGEDKASGGVRIIGERHKVFNNYFEHLNGDDYRSAICIMNGVPDSPLNRYFQVKDAIVAFNTIINCNMPLIVGAGKDDEKTLAPQDCVFANNVMDKTSGSKNITIEDEPINMIWEGNIINADANDEPIGAGVNYQNPGLEHVNYMWRPSPGSSLLNNAVGEYSYVELDLEQNQRSVNKTIGCDNGEVNTEWHPLSKEDVGPYSGQNEETSIARVQQVKDMVKVCRLNGHYLFQIINMEYLPVSYLISDVNGKLLKKGHLMDEVSFKTNTNGLYLGVFQSANKYIQSCKLLYIDSQQLSN
ncbi:polysaccharide lyase 6 family protein [Carboxylicivirga sp. A043]|uniref:polysaccharide lyase 6 family protein n=1 Tax=Carboxylicivirga litoralis TaxID=2816963 RepID=UPI0021CB91DE|nr:polysaccharide lyase 6 family protein [Carboxylicivirga sp. A043]MCU4157102.1 polysaccharide lyase 6 family protein [Carboxylicivirga sp. A043]